MQDSSLYFSAGCGRASFRFDRDLSAITFIYGDVGYLVEKTKLETTRET